MSEELKDDCIEFSGYKDAQGYGILSIKDARIKAHRIAFKLANPKISLTKNKLVCHHCDNPSCINPKHLFIGSIEDNIKDGFNKGRNARGERHGRAKLSFLDVITIREQLQIKMSQRRIAKRFGVSQKIIYLIAKGKIWKNIH